MQNFSLPGGVVVALRTLTPSTQVRILAGQPSIIMVSSHVTQVPYDIQALVQNLYSFRSLPVQLIL